MSESDKEARPAPHKPRQCRIKMFGVVPRLQAAVLSVPFVSENSTLKGLLAHPAGPFTIHFWAPTAKWLISAANIADVNRPVEKMSKPQQAGACGACGVWRRPPF